MTLLREIQQDAVNPTIDLPTLLRKCKILAARLRNDNFKKWVDNELNGYPRDAELPEHRILKVHSQGHFVGAFGRQLQNAPIPPSCLPEKLREHVTTAYMRDGVGELATLVRGKNGGLLHSAWPADIVAHYGSRIYEDMNCLAAWRVISKSQVAGILDIIRNKVLSFVLEIEAENPDAGDALPNEQPIPRDRVGQLYQTIIHGNVGNVSTGGSHISQNATVQILQNDFNSLRRFLLEQGLEPSDVDELKEAVSKDPQPSNPSSFGKRVSAWMGKMVAKAASGGWKVATAVASEVLAKALSSYYGLK
jgi:hypothetical protein